MSSTGGSSIVPCLRYRDALAAIEWLCEPVSRGPGSPEE